jgi:hypothetical protein
MWEAIDARMRGELDANEQREIELEENVRRKDLTEIERSRSMVTLAEVAQEVDREELRPESGRNAQAANRPQRPITPRSFRGHRWVPAGKCDTCVEFGKRYCLWEYGGQVYRVLGHTP